MTIKDELIKMLSRKYSIEERLVESIIGHQFDQAALATARHNSIEISGFGKFLFNNKRAVKQLDKYESQKAMYLAAISDSQNEEEIRVLSLKLKTVNNNIAHLKPKL